MLQALAVVAQKIEIHGRRVIALLDQLDLEIAGIGERDRKLDGRFLAAIAEPVGLHPLDVEKRPDFQRLRPEAERGLDVAHDIAVLTDIAEKQTHGNSLSRHSFRRAMTQYRTAEARLPFPRSAWLAIHGPSIPGLRTVYI